MLVMGSGKIRRILERLPDKTVPLDWDDYEYVLVNHFKFEMDESTGSSARTFTKGNETFTAYKPHGRTRNEKKVYKDDRDRAINALRRLGLLPED